MAIVKPIQDQAEWEEWLASRPPVVRDMATRWPPDRLYRMDSGHRCTLYSYAEDGTVTVEVTGEYNRVTFGRRVFGVRPETLVECDPPGPGEDVGDTAAEAGFTEDDVRTILIPKMRETHEMRERNERHDDQ